MVFEVPPRRFSPDRSQAIARLRHFLGEQPIDTAATCGSSTRSPAAAKALTAMAVSQTGDLHGCNRAARPSSITKSFNCS